MQNEILKSVIEDFVKKNKGIDTWSLLTSHLYSQGSIPKRKLKNALKYISKGVNEGELLFFVDLSSFGPGKEGLVFTSDKLFWRNYWAEQNEGMMEYGKINSVSIEGLIPATKKLVINSTKINISHLGGKERKLIQELLMQITRKEKERKQKGNRNKRDEKGEKQKEKERKPREAKDRIRRTELTIKLSETSFKPNVWKKIDLIFKNTGTVSAKAINVDYPKERVEIEGLKTIKELKPDEAKNLKIAFRPIQVGEVPLKIEINFKDLDNKEYKEEKTFWINVGDIIEKEEKQPAAAIEIKRGYEVLSNNNLRFGIRVINDSDYMIVDVQTMLDYPKTLFSTKDNVIQTLTNIPPNGERTAKYILTPLGCIHNEKIDATIFYKDHTGEKQTVQMQPKEVHCVCPFLKEKAMREGEFAELANRCEYIQEGLSFSGIGVNEITEFVKEACAHRLYVISEHEIDTAKIVYFAAESIGEKAFYLLTAVIQPYNNLTQVALRAYSDKPYGLHGFLNEIGNSIRHLVGSVQSAKEVGIIESKQVINIIDSVVQRTSFGGNGAGGTSTTDVNILDSVVQRSEIGMTRRCPSCGQEMQADERFCPECGVELEL